MAGLMWVRQDVAWPRNTKFLMLIEDKKFKAICLYWAALGWTAEQGQNGFVPYYALSSISGAMTRRDAVDLVSVALWMETEGGWDIHDYAEHQPSTEEHAKRSERARNAAHVRWNKQRELST